MKKYLSIILSLSLFGVVGFALGEHHAYQSFEKAIGSPEAIGDAWGEEIVHYDIMVSLMETTEEAESMSAVQNSVASVLSTRLPNVERLCSKEHRTKFLETRCELLLPRAKDYIQKYGVGSVANDV